MKPNGAYPARKTFGLTQPPRKPFTRNKSSNRSLKPTNPSGNFQLKLDQPHSSKSLFAPFLQLARAVSSRGALNASRIDWFTLFGVPFARPPQRVPFTGLGGTAAPGETGAMSDPDGEAPTVGRSDAHWTFDVIPLFRHYFSGDSSLNRRSFPTNCTHRTSSPMCPLGSAPRHGNSIHER